MPEQSYFMSILKPIATYALVPLWSALLLYIITEILCIKKGISLREGVKGKNFGLAAVTAILWIITSWIPSRIYLPQNAITLKIFTGIIALILTIKFVVFYFSELLAEENTLKELAIGSGIANARLVDTTVAKMVSEDDSLTNDGAATLFLENTVLIFRDFLIMSVVLFALGAFKAPPIFFLIPMLAMILICFGAFVGFSWKGQKPESPEYSFFSIRESLISMLLFMVVYYLSFFALKKFQYIGLYLVTGIVGVLYGGVTIFVLLAMMLTGKITVMVALYATVVVSAASIASNIFYTFISGAKKLSFYMLIVGTAAILIGIGTMLILA